MKTIPGFEDYEISESGEIRRRKTGRIMRTFNRKDGYVLVGLYREGKQSTQYVHRLVCLTFHGSPPAEGMEAAHRNGLSTDNRAENLRWATVDSNRNDKRTHGTVLAGQRHPGAKLTSAQVAEIRAMRAQGMTLKAIASQFKVHFSTIHDITKRGNWAQV